MCVMCATIELAMVLKWYILHIFKMRRDTKNKVWKMDFIESACQIDWQNKYFSLLSLPPPLFVSFSLSHLLTTSYPFSTYTPSAITSLYWISIFMFDLFIPHFVVCSNSAAQLPMNDFNICALRLALNCCRCRVCNCSFVYSQSIFWCVVCIQI